MQERKGEQLDEYYSLEMSEDMKNTMVVDLDKGLEDTDFLHLKRGQHLVTTTLGHCVKYYGRYRVACFYRAAPYVAIGPHCNYTHKLSLSLLTISII